MPGTSVRNVEPDIYSLLPNDRVGNSYDDKFGTVYDLVACNPLYNRIIWGYATAKFASLVEQAIKGGPQGMVLGIGCGGADGCGGDKVPGDESHIRQSRFLDKL